MRRVTATTDARGQFVAKLLPRRACSAFACGGGQGDGSALVSACSDLAGVFVRLALIDVQQHCSP